MIKINDNYYDLNLIDIINELKYELELNNIFLFQKIKDTETDLMVSCPFHKQGKEKRPSCGIRKEDGFLHCFTCDTSCSLVEMISKVFGYDDWGKFGQQWLNKNFLSIYSENRKVNLQLDRTKNIIKQNFITETELNKYRYIHPYMYQRKMTDKVIEIFDLGYDKETNSLTFPVRDKEGNCLFVARRNVAIKYFNYPSTVEKPVYGIYELYQLEQFPKEIYICESMIDAITLWTVDKYAVALNGLGTKLQFNQLNEMPCRKFILATDSDSAGMKARERIRQNIKNKIITEVVLPTGRKDINECSTKELKNILEIF